MYFVRVPYLIITSLLTITIYPGTELPLAEAKPSSKTCKYWCKDDDARYFCCPSGKKPSTSIWPLTDLITIPTKLLPHFSNLWSLFNGHTLQLADWLWLDERHFEETHNHQEPSKQRCPELRPACPRDWLFKPPVSCDTNEECGYAEMCCFDVCLDHKTCKPGVPDD